MARNDFMFVWLIVASFVLLLVVAATAFFVYQSGLLSGEIPLVGETTESANPYFGGATEEVEGGGEETQINLRVSRVTVYSIDPREKLLVSEQRSVQTANTDSGYILNVLRSMHQAPDNSSLEPAVPPEMQIRTVFVEAALNTVYIDLVTLPESWENASPVEVSLSLYAIAHTIRGLNPQFRFVRFLVDGKDSEETPGGILLTEPFHASEDWLAPSERT
jgi:hypothetical protein